MTLSINMTRQSALQTVAIRIMDNKKNDDSVSNTNETDKTKSATGTSTDPAKSAAANETEGGSTGGGVSPAVATLQQRIRELEKQLREQQQALQQISAKKYASENEKTTAIMGAQSQVAATSGALQQASAQLAEELSKNPVRVTA